MKSHRVIYLFQVSGRLDHNSNPNTNPKEGKGEMLRLKFVFESFFEMDDGMWGERGCISEDFDSFVSDYIFFHRW